MLIKPQGGVHTYMRAGALALDSPRAHLVIWGAVRRERDGPKRRTCPRFLSGDGTERLVTSKEDAQIPLPCYLSYYG